MFKPDRVSPLGPGHYLDEGRDFIKSLCNYYGAHYDEIEKILDKAGIRCGYLISITRKDGTSTTMVYGARENFHLARQIGAVDSFTEEMMQKAIEGGAPFFLRYLGQSCECYLFPRDDFWKTGRRTIRGHSSVKTYEYRARQGKNLEKWLQET